MLSILRKARLKDKELRILMLGLDNSGKTSIVKQIMGEDPMQVSPTLGFIIKTIDFGGYTLNIWDVGGQKTLRAYWRNYFEKTDALIWVVDTTDRLRLAACRDELHALLQEERLAGATLLVFANKSDIDGCLTPEEVEHELALSVPKAAVGPVTTAIGQVQTTPESSQAQQSQTPQTLSQESESPATQTQSSTDKPSQASPEQPSQISQSQDSQPPSQSHAPASTSALRTHTWRVLRCSAMTGEGLHEGLQWVVDDAKQRLFLY